MRRKRHPGFKGAMKSIERREGVGKKRAGAILAAGARKAGAKARRMNPRLERVGGMPERGGRNPFGREAPMKERMARKKRLEKAGA